MNRFKNYQLAAAGFVTVVAIIVYGAATAVSTDLNKVMEKKSADLSIAAVSYTHLTLPTT